MKRCPACRRVLPDEAMILCPYDGTLLLDTMVSADAFAETIKLEPSGDEVPVPSSRDPIPPLVKVDDLYRALDSQILKRRKREAYSDRQVLDAELSVSPLIQIMFWFLLAVSVVIVIPVSVALFYAIIPSRSGILFGLVTGVVLSVALWIMGFRRLLI